MLTYTFKFIIYIKKIFTFFEKKNFIIIECNFKCKRCTSFNVCIECKGDRLSTPNCMCKDNTFDDGI